MNPDLHVQLHFKTYLLKIPAYSRRIMRLLFLSLVSAFVPSSASSSQTYTISPACSQAVASSVRSLAAATDGQKYVFARKSFIANGWLPDLADNDSASLPYEDRGPQEKAFLDKGFTEIEDCAVDGGDPCNLVFSDAKHDVLRVGTGGLEGYGHHARIGFLNVTCPPNRPS